MAHRAPPAPRSPCRKRFSVLVFAFLAVCALPLVLLAFLSGGGPPVVSRPSPSAAASSRAEQVPLTPSATPQWPKSYVVQPGDTLSSIAVRFYGAADRWTWIYAANKTVIEAHGGVLVPGMRLVIPSP